jgi:hypothetical protein
MTSATAAPTAGARQVGADIADRADIAAAHFARWLTLWCATVDDRHAGPKAELAKLQATRIAGAMCRRITGTSPADSNG